MPAPRNPHIRIGKIDLVGSVHLTLSVDTVGRKARADLLYQQARSLYDDALTEAIAEVGCSGPGHLAGGAELSALKKRVEWSATSIAKTYNRDLLTMVEAAEADWVEGHGSKKGMTRLWLAKTVRPAIQERDAWKETQIGVTESTWVNDRARQDFFGRNQIEGEMRVSPQIAVCPVCQEYVRRGWMKISEAVTLELPNHPGCPHTLEARPLKDTVPDCASLWRGQVKTGRKGEGTEALIDALTERVAESTAEGQVLEYNPFHDAMGRFTSGGGAGSRVNLNDPRAVTVAKGEGKGVLLGHRGDERNYRDMNKSISADEDYIAVTQKWGESLFADWKGRLTESEFTAIQGYANKDFYKLNKQLRGRPTSEGRFAPDKFREMCNNLDSALGKSQIPESMIVYRGGGHNTLRVAVHEGKIGVGTVFRDKGYVSTSIVQKGAMAHAVEIKIRIPKGTHGAFIGWNGFTGYKNEAEMILPRNQRFLVRKIETHTQGVRLELDLL